MPQHTLEKRMENLENIVASLAEVPILVKSLSSQFLQLRQDVRADISALHLRVDGVSSEVGELRGEVGELRSDVGELRSDVGTQKGELHAVRDELRAGMAAMHTELAGAILANGVEMRTLHEELVRRITLLGEANRD